MGNLTRDNPKNKSIKMSHIAETIWLDEVDSTNSFAVENFDSFANGTLICASRQTAGRGSRGRKWVSPPDVNVYASLILKGFRFAPGQAAWIGSLAALETLRRHAPRLDLSVKWPNDVLCGYRKIAGVLCDAKPSSGIVIGIGVNLNMDAEALAAVGRPATSFLIETKRRFRDVGSFAVEMADAALTLYHSSLKKGIEPLHRMWSEENFLLNRTVSIVLPDHTVRTGKVVSFLSDGSISMELDSNAGTVNIKTGEIDMNQFINPFDRSAF